MPGLYREGDYDLAGFAVGAAERGALAAARRRRRATRCSGLASSGVHSNGFSLVRRVVEASGAALDGAGAVRSGGDARPGADDADADLCAGAAGAASGRAAEGGGAHHRRRPAGQSAAGAAGRIPWPCWSRYWPMPPVFALAGAHRRRGAGGDAAGVQLRHRHGGGGRRPGCRERSCCAIRARALRGSATSRPAADRAEVRIDLPAGWPG